MTQYLDNLALREAAFARLDQLSLLYDECIPWVEIEKGFRFKKLFTLITPFLVWS